MKKRTLLFILIPVILVTAGLFILPHITKDPGARGPGLKPMTAGSDKAVFSVRTLTMREGTISDYIKINGDVITVTEVDIYPEVGGKLVDLNANIGDYIRKGDMIAEVDPSKPGTIYSNSPVRSTISGTVTSVPGEIGSTVTTSTSIIKVGDLKNLQVRTYIPELQLSRVKMGQTADIIFDAYPDRVYKAKIVKMSPVVDAESRTLEIRLKLDDIDENVRVGMFGSIKLITATNENSFIVPEDCLLERSGEKILFIIDNDGKAEKRIVRTGIRADGFVEITEGLNSGDRVVTQGQSFLSEGVPVEIVEGGK